MQYRYLPIFSLFLMILASIPEATAGSQFRDAFAQAEAREYCEGFLRKLPLGPSRALLDSLTQLGAIFSNNHNPGIPVFPKIEIAFNAPQGWSLNDVLFYLNKNYPSLSAQMRIDVADHWTAHFEIDRHNANVLVSTDELSRTRLTNRKIDLGTVPLSRVFFIFSGSKAEILEILNDPHGVARRSHLLDEVFPSPRRFGCKTFHQC